MIPIISTLFTCHRRTSSRRAIRGKAPFVLLSWYKMNSRKRHYTLSENLEEAVSKVAQNEKGSDDYDFFFRRVPELFCFTHPAIRLRLDELEGVEPLRELLRKNLRWGERLQKKRKKSEYLWKGHFRLAFFPWGIPKCEVTNIRLGISTPILPTPDNVILIRYLIRS